MKINYAKAQRFTQLAVIHVISFSLVGIGAGLLHIALLINGLYIPETFIGLMSGFYVLPALISKLKSMLMAEPGYLQDGIWTYDDGTNQTTVNVMRYDVMRYDKRKGTWDIIEGDKNE